MRGYRILLAFTFVLRTDSEVTCDAPAVERGSPANITCLFDTDIMQTRKPFGIDRYNDGNPRPKIVLRCHWPEENSTNPRCTHKEGYSYDLVDTRGLNLQISSTTEEHVGDYTCLEMASDETVKHCKLTLKQSVNDSVVTCDAPVVVRGSPANITCHFDTDISRTRTPFGVDRYIAGHRQVVLRCHWPDGNRTVPKCTHKKGYSYNLAATRDLTLQISSTTEDNVGPYVCQELGSDDYLEQCEITLKEDATDSTPTSEPGHSSTSSTLSEDNAYVVPLAVTFSALVCVLVVLAVVYRKRLCYRNIPDDSGKASEHGDIGSKSKRDSEKRLSDIEEGVFTVDTNQTNVDSTVNEPLLPNSPADDETPADDERQEPSAENDDDSGYVLLANQDQDPGLNVVVYFGLSTQAGGDNEQREDEISDEDEDDGIEEALEKADKAGPPCLGTPRTRRIWRKLKPIVNEIKEHGVEFLHPVPDEFKRQSAQRQPRNVQTCPMKHYMSRLHIA